MAKANPNMFDLIFAPKKYWLKTSPYWEMIYEHRNDFLSKKARFTYSGYAFAQLKRIETHRKWLLNPPSHQPKRKEFGFEKCPVSKDLIRAVLSIPNYLLAEGIKEDVKKEQKYQSKLQDWQNFENWKKNRNPKRAALEAKIGYDSKHASHLIRLLRTGKEILTQGKVLVDRRDIDAKDLKSIRNCEWSYDKVVGEAKDMDQELIELYDKSTLRHKVDMNKLNDLCIAITEQYWKDNN